MRRHRNYQLDGPCKNYRDGTCRKVGRYNLFHASCPTYHKDKPKRWFLHCHEVADLGNLDIILGLR